MAARSKTKVPPGQAKKPGNPFAKKPGNPFAAKPANPFAAGKPTTMLPPKTPGVMAGVMTGATGKPTPFIAGPAKAPSGTVSRLLASMRKAPLGARKGR